MNKRDIDSLENGLKSFVPDNYKKDLKVSLEKDKSVVITYTGKQDEIIVKELNHYFKVFVSKKAYLKSIDQLKVLKKSIKYIVEVS